MIVGVGVDIVEVERIKQKLNKGNAFRDQVFGPEEIAYCDKRQNSYESYAARFAAKEAFLKAMGTGFHLTFDLHELQVLHKEQGQPYFSFSADLKKIILATLGFEPKVHVSLSHSGGQAVGFVVIEK